MIFHWTPTRHIKLNFPCALGENFVFFLFTLLALVQQSFFEPLETINNQLMARECHVTKGKEVFTANKGNLPNENSDKKKSVCIN